MKKNRRRSGAVFAAFSALALLLGGCGAAARSSPASAGAARTLTDREGSAFTVHGVPRRIISGAPSNTEIIAALGLAGHIIAADRYSAKVEGVPPGIPLIDFFFPDAEAIIGLEPDIIIANGYNRFGAGDDPFRLLRENGIPAAYIPMSDSVAGIRADIAFIAELLGAREKGAQIIRAMTAEIENVRSAAAAFPPRKVYFEISPAPDMVSLGKHTYLNEMIEIAGGINIFADVEGILFPGAENIIERDPDVILTNAAYADNVLGEIRARQGFDRLAAVRENRIFFIDQDSSSRPTQNIVKALRQMAEAIGGAAEAGDAPE